MADLTPASAPDVTPAPAAGLTAPESIELPHLCPPAARPYVLATAILASALGFIDGSIVAIAIPQIRLSLAASFVEAQWIANAYLLLLAALLLLGGAAGDRFGVRRTFGFGIAVFTAASLACALAPAAPWLIAARVVQGAGAAIMVPCSLALIARNYPRELRGRAIGAWSSASALMTIAGPVLGGLVLALDTQAWRWAFAINLPLGALALAMLRRVPDDAPRAGRDAAGARGRPLDIAGASLATAALGLVALGLTLLGSAASAPLSGWVRPWPVVSAGVVLAAAFVWWQARAAHPMIRLGLFRSRGFAGANAATLLLYAALGGFLFYLPMTVVSGWSLGEWRAGLLFVPVGLMIALLSPIAGRHADRHGARLPLTLGPAVVGCGFVVIAWIADRGGLGPTGFWLALLPAVAIVGFGLGLTVSPLSSAVMLAVEDAESGAASGINNMVARMANLFAIAGFGALAALVHEVAIAASDLAPPLRDAVLAAGYGEPLQAALRLPQVIEVRGAAMGGAFAIVALVAAALAFAAAALGWWTQAPPRGTGRPLQPGVG